MFSAPSNYSIFAMPSILALTGALVLSVAPTSASAQPSPAACKRAVQGKIAWNKQGSKQWAPNNLNRLCRNARNDQPARCFRRVMHGKVNYGGGTNWKWENAIDLCEQSDNANRTISCFRQQINRGQKWQQAIPKCDERAPKMSCKEHVQGKIAWNKQGNKQWAPNNLNRLCGNMRNDQPARCFRRVMHGNINYGGGTNWKWENAIDLCEKSTDANRTINCFRKQIKRGQKWQQAIKRCGR